MIPGFKAKHAIITPSCRTKGDMEAFEEAVERLRQAYKEGLKGWKTPVNYHLVLKIEKLDGA